MPLAFVLVKARVGMESQAQAALQSLAGVAEVHCIFGDHDLLCRVEGPDFVDLGNIVTKGIHKSEVVASTHTMTVRPDVQLAMPPAAASA